MTETAQLLLLADLSLSCTRPLSSLPVPALLQKPRENGRAVNRFGESARLGGSAGGGGVGWRGPGRVPVVGCLQDPGAEVAGIRASSGRVVLRCARRVFTQQRRPQFFALQRWLNGASLRCACFCPLTELPCVLLRWHTLCLAGYHALAHLCNCVFICAGSVGCARQLRVGS